MDTIDQDAAAAQPSAGQAAHDSGMQLQALGLARRPRHSPVHLRQQSVDDFLTPGRPRSGIFNRLPGQISQRIG
ncbi:MAG: hypothetical protein ABI434_01180 [Burkholderiaceae bacterium]